MRQLISVFRHSHLRYFITQLYIDSRWVDEMTTLFPLVPLSRMLLHDPRDCHDPHIRKMLLDQLMLVDLPVLMSIYDLLPSLSKVTVNSSSNVWTALSDRNYVDHDCLPPPIFVAALKRLGKQYESALPRVHCAKPMSPSGTLMICALNASVPHLRALALEGFDPGEIYGFDEYQINIARLSNKTGAYQASPFTLLRQTIGRLEHLDLRLRNSITRSSNGLL